MTTRRRASACCASLAWGLATLFVVALAPRPLHAQVCTGSMELTTQAQVDSFDCTVLSSLSITGTGITNLDGLSSLTSVVHDVLIFTDALTNVDGLSSLTSVGRRLTLFSNNALTNVDGLSSLTSVGGDVSLTTNSALTRCCGLFPLLNGTGVGGTVEISGNDAGCNSAQDILDGGPCVVAVDETTWGNMKVFYR